MSGELNNAVECYGVYCEKEIIGFCAVIHSPHAKVKNLKRCHRLVVLPDYQGIGIGTQLLNIIAEHYLKIGYRFSITTSARNMIYSLNKSDKWKLKKYGANPSVSKFSTMNGSKGERTKCKTASFEYIS